MMTYCDFDHTKFIGVPFDIIPTKDVVKQVLGVPNIVPAQPTGNQVAVVYDYNTPFKLLNQDNYWVYGIITEAEGYIRGGKGITAKSIRNKPFYAIPCTRTYNYLAEGDTDFHVQIGTLLNGTSFYCDSAKVRLIKFKA